MITVKYEAQAWQNDYAIMIDPDGPDTWDVSDKVLAEIQRQYRDPDDALAYETWFVDDPNAPEWIKERPGPFFVSIVYGTPPWAGTVMTSDKMVHGRGRHRRESEAARYARERTRARNHRYTGYGIVVIDGGDYGAICYTHDPETGQRWISDEHAVVWATGHLEPETWTFVALTDGRNDEPSSS